MRIWPTKRWWKRFAIGVAIVVALALIANGVMAWWTEHRLQTRIAAIRAAGDPASIADLAPEPIPDDENAAAILKRLKPQLAAFSKDQARFYDSALGKVYSEAENRGEPATEEQIAAIREIIEKYPELEAGIAAAAQCQKYGSQMDFSLDHEKFLDVFLKDGMDVRTAARFAHWRAKLLMHDVKSQEAVDQGIHLLRLARLHESEPLLFAFLVNVAVRSITTEMLYDALATGPITAEQHAQLDRELALCDDPQQFVKALKTERAFSASVTMENGLFPSQAQVNPIWVRMVGWPVKSLYVNALESFDGQLTLAARPWHEVYGRKGTAGEVRGKSGFGILADLLQPAIQAGHTANARDLAMLRALRIFNALTEFRDEHGREASGLEELALPKEAMIDPFSGEPLKLKHTDEGWVVYSVMANGVDDGGDFKDQKDYGLAPAKWRSTN